MSYFNKMEKKIQNRLVIKKLLFFQIKIDFGVNKKKKEKKKS